MLQRGDAVPHFDVRTTAGEVFSYVTIWQHKNLVLVVLPKCQSHDSYASGVSAQAAEFPQRDTVLVVTRDEVPGIQAPGVLIADKWGEVMHVVEAAEIAALPNPQEVREWVDYVANRCPECEGEAR